MARGTCWIFAAVAVLEHAYRMQGVASKYLEADQYLRLSEQAFGISILDSCAELADESCLIGDEVWVGNQLKPVDTQGGSASLLFWLKRLETTAAMPRSVCNYTETSGHDHLCPGLDSALAHSPLSFQTLSITTLFDREDVKAALAIYESVHVSSPVKPQRFGAGCLHRVLHGRLVALLPLFLGPTKLCSRWLCLHRHC